MKNSSWACQHCKNADKECSACKVKYKEMHNLKRNIADFERNTEYLNYELKICNERITDLEDRLNKEKKLRKFIETNLEELKEQEQRRPGCRRRRRRSQNFDQRFTRSREERSNNFIYNTESTIVNGSFFGGKFEVYWTQFRPRWISQTEQPNGCYCASISELTSSKSGSSRKSGHQPWLPQPGLVQQ